MPDDNTLITPPEPEPTPEPVTKPIESEDDLPGWARDSLTKANKEAATYRTRAQSYEQAFEGYADDEREAWLNLVKAAANPVTRDEALQLMRDLAAEEEIDYGEQQAAGLSAEDVQAMIQEQMGSFAQQQQMEESVKEVQAEARALGYNPESEDYILLLHYANQMDEPDLSAASESVKAYKQAQIDAFLSDKANSAASSPRVPAQTGSAPNLVTPPRTLAEARKAAEERFANL